MFMLVVTDMIRFKGTFLAIFYGENHIFCSDFWNGMMCTYSFLEAKCQK